MLRAQRSPIRWGAATLLNLDSSVNHSVVGGASR